MRDERLIKQWATTHYYAQRQHRHLPARPHRAVHVRPGCAVHEGPVGERRGVAARGRARPRGGFEIWKSENIRHSRFAGRVTLNTTINPRGSRQLYSSIVNVIAAM
jgi:hypothetical protein